MCVSVLGGHRARGGTVALQVTSIVTTGRDTHRIKVLHSMCAQEDTNRWFNVTTHTLFCHMSCELAMCVCVWITQNTNEEFVSSGPVRQHSE